MADGNDTYTKILLHFNGSDAGTTITDDNAGGSAHTWTANGNANTDTGIVKFGTAALLCDGSGDYVTTPDHADLVLGSSDFTIDFWFNVAVAGNGTLRGFAGQCDSSALNSSTSFRCNIGTTNVISGAVADGVTAYTITGSTAIITTGWHHYAFVRTGNFLKLFLDGVQESTDLAIAVAVNNSANAFALGRRGEQNNSYYNGSLDEFRLSVGIARWTTNFTPPTDEYSAAQIITGALFTNTNTFFGSTLSSVSTIAGALFDDTDTFFSATITTPAPQTITGALVTDADTFFASLIDVADPQTITAALITNTSTFFRSSNTQTDGPSTDITRLYHTSPGYKRWFWAEAAKRQIRDSLRKPAR